VAFFLNIATVSLSLLYISKTNNLSSSCRICPTSRPLCTSALTVNHEIEMKGKIILSVQMDMNWIQYFLHDTKATTFKGRSILVGDVYTFCVDCRQPHQTRKRFRLLHLWKPVCEEDAGYISHVFPQNCCFLQAWPLFLSFFSFPKLIIYLRYSILQLSRHLIF